MVQCLRILILWIAACHGALPFFAVELHELICIVSATDCARRLSTMHMATRSIVLRSIVEPGSTSGTSDSTNLFQQSHHLRCMRYSTAKWTGSVMPSTVLARRDGSPDRPLPQYGHISTGSHSVKSGTCISLKCGLWLGCAPSLFPGPSVFFHVLMYGV